MLETTTSNGHNSPPTASNTTNGWPCSAAQYDLGILIEKGSFSSVYTGICKTNQQKLCVKIMDLENMTVSLEKILQEIQLMRLCNDPNILTYYTNFVHTEQLWLITQVLDKGSAHRVLQFSKALQLGEGLPEDCIAYIVAEALKGIHYLHSRSLIHRDLKPGNILLDSRGQVKLADLAIGSSTSFDVGQKARTVIGTPLYMAPEVFEQEQNQYGYDSRADIWSLGITILELAKGVPPYGHLPAMKLMAMTLENDPPSLESYPVSSTTGQSSFSKNFEDFYRQCLQKNPKHRPSAAELLKHRYVRACTSEKLVELLAKIPDIDDVEGICKIVMGCTAQTDQIPSPDHRPFAERGTNIAEVLEDFEGIITNDSEYAESAVTITTNERLDSGLQTPTRFVSRRTRADSDLDPTLIPPSLASSTSVGMSRSRSTEQSLSPEKFSENLQIESRQTTSDETREGGEGYVPGTTWVFETSFRDEKGQFKSYEAVKNLLQAENPHEDGKEEKEKDKDSIHDFLDEFEANDATIKSEL